MTTSKQLEEIELDNRKLESLIIALRKLVNSDDEGLQIDLYTCFNHADNEHQTDLQEIDSLLSGLLSARKVSTKNLAKEYLINLSK